MKERERMRENREEREYAHYKVHSGGESSRIGQHRNENIETRERERERKKENAMPANGIANKHANNISSSRNSSSSSSHCHESQDKALVANSHIFFFCFLCVRIYSACRVLLNKIR